MILTHSQVLPKKKLDTENISVLKAIPAAEFKDMVNYSSFLNNSN